MNWTKSTDIADDEGFLMEGVGNDLKIGLILLIKIVKCFVVPPRHPLHGVPVLPNRLDNFLLFPLCSSCAKKMQGKNKKKPNYQCKHFKDEERGFTTTIPTIELGMALDVSFPPKFYKKWYLGGV